MPTASHDARCPVCAAAVSRALAVVADRPLRRCQACGHAFLEVEAPSTLEPIYNDHYAGFREDPVFRREASRVIREELMPLVPPPARLLDVGCGNGEFLALARDAGYRATGIDISAAAVELCQQRGLDVRVGDLRSRQLFAADERFDLITFWDVVEHLPDPISFLRRAHELLAARGSVLIKTPATSRASVRLAAAVPRLAGALLQAPSHVQFFAREHVDVLLRKVGFSEPRRLEARAMRSPARGGRLRRRFTRRLERAFQRAAGDGNILVVARRT